MPQSLANSAATAAIWMSAVLAAGLAQAQVRGLGTDPLPPPSVSDILGDCPVEELRAAWPEMEALEAAAVEQEVLRLCTERARVINEFLKAQRSLNEALNEPGPAVWTEPPQTVNAEKNSEPVTGLDSGNDARARLLGAAQADTGGSIGSSPLDELLPGPPTSRTEIAPSGQEWQVLFTVRGTDDHWRAWIERPGPASWLSSPFAADSEAGDGTELLPIPTERHLVGEGDRLPDDDREVTRINEDGVHVVDAAGTTSQLRWSTARQGIEPGDLEFRFSRQEGQGG